MIFLLLGLDDVDVLIIVGIVVFATHCCFGEKTTWRVAGVDVFTISEDSSLFSTDQGSGKDVDDS